MKTRVFLILSILLLSLALAACDGSSAAGSTPAAVPAGAGAASLVTPGAQRARPAGAATSAAAPAPAATATAATASTAPTAVPVPVVIVPTPLVERTQAPKVAAQASATPTTQPAVVVPGTTSPAKERTLEELRGKLIFFSDRGGGYPQLYVMDADGGNQQLCNCLGVLETVVDQEVTSPDGGQTLYVTTVGGGRGGGDIQIWVHRNATNEDLPLTGGAPGFPGVDYDPAWSPDARYVAWVSQADGADEIYLYDRQTNESQRLTQSNGEWYKHPTFSTDGSQIAYWTNVQNAERKQIWVMNRDGSGKHNISANAYNDWDPTWIK